MPKVSIVLPTYNGAKYISESIASIVNQTLTDWELVVINDCSTDNTLDIVNDFASKDNRIKVYTNNANLKLPASLNAGFKHTSGRYYTWTSDDNRYKKNALEEMVKVLDNNTDIGLLYCDMDVIDDNGNLVTSYNLKPIENIINGNIIGACFMYRADIAKKIGEYEKDFFLAEDYEYWLRFFFHSRIYKNTLNLYEYRRHSKSLTSENSNQVSSQVAKVKHKHLKKIVEKISDKVTLHGLYCHLVSNGIVLNKNEIKLFKDKDKDIVRWYKSFIFYNNYNRLGSMLHKSMNFDLPEELKYYIRIPSSNLKKINIIVKSVIKFILPYGFVKIIQKLKK